MSVKVGRFDTATAIIPELTEFAPSMPELAELGINQVNGLIDLYHGRLDSAIAKFEISYQVGEALGLRALAGPLLISLGWARLGRGERDVARQTALSVFQFVQSYSGGWRVAEPQILLGAIALADEDLEAADRWFTKALESAARAPEWDLLVWALTGLAATSAATGARDLAAHLQAHLEPLKSDGQLFFPQFVDEWWTVLIPDGEPCSQAGVPGELDHLLGIAKASKWLGGSM